MLKKISPIVVSLLILFFSGDALAAKKKKKHAAPKITYVDPADVFSINVNIKVGTKKKSKQKAYTVYCLDKTPGNAANTQKGMMFKSYSSMLKTMQKKKGSPSKISLYKQLKKAGEEGCNKPDFLSLEKYKGKFGEAEARIIYDRFAFGASPEQIADAAQRGLERVVDDLTTYKPEPALDAIEQELRCDGRLSSDPENEQCDPNNPNDIYFPGVREGIYYRMWYSQNPFFEKLFMFLHDERMATSARVLSSCERHALLTHIDMLRRAAISGDYARFVSEFSTDHLGHLRWLSGALNRGTSPNEDYGREVLELGTVGPTRRDGTPVYNDFDIANSALAFSGWSIEGYEQGDYYVCYGSYVPGLHAQGPKTIFNGTPEQTTVYDGEDVVQAALAHPRTAEHIAEDLWKEFINPYATDSAIRELAKIIRDNNYNLIPVMKRVMTSRAMFANRSNRSLIKHPVDLLFGFLRTTGLPISYYYIDEMLSDLGQQPTLAPTVFGWNEKKLAGESHILDWRNNVLMMVGQDSEDLLEKGFSFQDRFLTGLSSTANPSAEAIDRVSTWLNIPLNQAQKDRLVEFLNYSTHRCWNTEECGGQEYVLERDAFDPHPDNKEESDPKIRGLLAILAMLPDYRLK